MRTVRRLYFYILALIGAEAVVWGAVALLRTVISSGLIGAAGQIATGLSAVLGGLPVFLFHWLIVQRDAARDAAADGSFVFAVRTTGVYCRPSCPARHARPENVEFHATATAAERA